MAALSIQVADETVTGLAASVSSPHYTAMSAAKEDEEVMYEEEEEEEVTTGAAAGAAGATYVDLHASGFKEFALKPELAQAIGDCGFEHPSSVQQTCIPQAIMGLDVICQAKSGMGKTAVFVLVSLQQLEPEDGVVSCLVLSHTRELAYQIWKEYVRFSKFLPDVRSGVIFGGIPIRQDRALLKGPECPHIVVGTPGRIKGLVSEGTLKLNKLKIFVIDECDKILEQQDMRQVVQEIFIQTPRDKQVMMFSATLSKEIRPICRKFMHETPLEMYLDDETKLTLHGLTQYYSKLDEAQKNRKLNDLLDHLDFNQVVIFVSKTQRATELNRLLTECNFPSICIHGSLKQPERIARYNSFKACEKRILVTTDLMGRGIDIEKVNVVINYDFPGDSDYATGSDSYLHRVGRAGRFGTIGLAISFVSSEADAKVLADVQSRFEVKIEELPDEIDTTKYMPQAES